LHPPERLLVEGSSGYSTDLVPILELASRPGTALKKLFEPLFVPVSATESPNFERQRSLRKRILVPDQVRKMHRHLSIG
jgi:hypothetical protein